MAKYQTMGELRGLDALFERETTRQTAQEIFGRATRDFARAEASALDLLDLTQTFARVTDEGEDMRLSTLVALLESWKIACARAILSEHVRSTKLTKR